MEAGFAILTSLKRGPNASNWRTRAAARGLRGQKNSFFGPFNSVRNHRETGVDFTTK